VGFFRKPNVDRADAATEVRFHADFVSVTWHGDAGLLMRSPHVYLDWAVSKDSRERAAAALFRVIPAFLDESEGDRRKSLQWTLVDEVPSPGVEVTTSYTVAIGQEAMLSESAFRPRRAILDYMSPTFWALWNKLVSQGEKAPDSIDIEALVDDLRTQIEYYEQRGFGTMRGGPAPMYAAKVGAGRRMEQEIAEFAGLSVDEFRALSESERDEVIERHATAGVENMTRLHEEVAAFAGLTVEELEALPQPERDAIYERALGPDEYR
jgi:hypothetical protein